MACRLDQVLITETIQDFKVNLLPDDDAGFADYLGFTNSSFNPCRLEIGHAKYFEKPCDASMQISSNPVRSSLCSKIS
jgi:hypothetical protein